MDTTPCIIAGPTASGKSSYALKQAVQNNGVIINADSLQVYQQMPTLTAQPTASDRDLVPHKLYGILDGRVACTVAYWQSLVLNEIKKAQSRQQKPYIVIGILCLPQALAIYH